jgi:hypothetical protein
VYSRKIGDKDLTFGVSGLLYKANVLMYDRQTESLWSQVLRKAVTGTMTDTPLKVLPSTLTTWKRWKKRHPDTLVLSLETGHRRDYTRDPYESYYESSRGFFSRVLGGPGEEEKMLVAGVEVGGATKAYPLDVLREKGSITDKVGTRNLTLVFETETDALVIRDAKGSEVPHIVVYWFVWKDFHPGTGLYRP